MVYDVLTQKAVCVLSEQKVVCYKSMDSTRTEGS